MPRPLRIKFPSAIYHIVSRGNRKQQIYLDDNNRLLFLDLLSYVTKTYNWDCYAYCLMDNHYHLLIETKDPNISESMAYLNSVYAQKFNKINQADGHLFQGRYYASLIEQDAHLLDVSRYIDLNPITAGLVASPEEWPWSSYRAHAGLEADLKFLSTNKILELFSNNIYSAQLQYRLFIKEGMEMKKYQFMGVRPPDPVYVV